MNTASSKDTICFLYTKESGFEALSQCVHKFILTGHGVMFDTRPQMDRDPPFEGAMYELVVEVGDHYN